MRQTTTVSEALSRALSLPQPGRSATEEAPVMTSEKMSAGSTPVSTRARRCRASLWCTVPVLEYP
jgi:hypothetical protein